MTQTTHTNNYHIQVEALGCTRGEQSIFSDVSFQTSAGEAVLLRGPNGTGKSSLLMCLAGLLQFDGNINIMGRDSELHENADIHFVSHLPALKSNLSVTQNLKFWARLNGGDPFAIPEALVSAKLDHAADLDAGTLSAGQVRRLSLLRLLVAQRPIWLLDEPTSALDSQGEEWVGSLIDAHLKRNGIAIVATHLDIPLKTTAHIVQIGPKR